MTPPLRLHSDRLALARKVLRGEAAALLRAADRLGVGFQDAVDRVAGAAGRLAVTGVGKSADVGQKIVGTLNSTGTRAYALDATRALHGDLGMVHPDDGALILSHSGESEELLRLLPWLKDQAAFTIAVTGNGDSSLARLCDAVIAYGPIDESCPLSLAPSASTAVMLGLGDALAFTLSEMREFTPAQFARFHPAGSLGRRLARVDSVMRSGDQLRLAPATATVREVFSAGPAGRRTGAVMLIKADGTLAGLFTDSDLARLFERRDDAAFDRPVAEFMTRCPTTVTSETRLAEAAELLRGHKFSELPVVDAGGRPVGLLDVTDVVGLAPAAERLKASA